MLDICAHLRPGFKSKMGVLSECSKGWMIKPIPTTKKTNFREDLQPVAPVHFLYHTSISEIDYAENITPFELSHKTDMLTEVRVSCLQYVCRFRHFPWLPKQRWHNTGFSEWKYLKMHLSSYKQFHFYVRLLYDYLHDRTHRCSDIITVYLF